MRKTLIVAVISFFSSGAFTQSTPTEITDRFFTLYKLGDSDKAIDFLFTNTPYANEIAEGIDDVKRKLKKNISQIGNFYGADLLTSKTASLNLIMFTYLVRHDREPLVFSLMFYKPNDKWHLQNFKYKNSSDEELEEASKAYRLKENIIVY